MATLGQLKSTRLPRAGADGRKPRKDLSRLIQSSRDLIKAPDAKSDVTLWTQFTAKTSRSVTDVTGVSTVAKQRRARRALERHAHDEAQQERETVECSLLHAQIAQARSSLLQTQARAQELTESNLRLIEVIENRDLNSIATVSELIADYTQCLQSVQGIHAHHKHHLEQRTAGAAEQDKHLQHSKKRLEEQVAILDLKLNEGYHELDELMEYREAGQFRLREKIFALKVELDTLIAAQNQEMEDLHRAIDSMRDTMRQDHEETQAHVKEQLSHHVVEQLPSYLRSRTVDIARLRKEMELQLSIAEELRAQNVRLEETLRLLHEQVKHSEQQRTAQLAARVQPSRSFPPALYATTSISVLPPSLSTSRLEDERVHSAVTHAKAASRQADDLLLEIEQALAAPHPSYDSRAFSSARHVDDILSWTPMGLSAAKHRPVTTQDMFG